MPGRRSDHIPSDISVSPGSDDVPAEDVHPDDISSPVEPPSHAVIPVTQGDATAKKDQEMTQNRRNQRWKRQT